MGNYYVLSLLELQLLLVWALLPVLNLVATAGWSDPVQNAVLHQRLSGALHDASGFLGGLAERAGTSALRLGGVGLCAVWQFFAASGERPWCS